jgi:hypothetical protein
MSIDLEGEIPPPGPPSTGEKLSVFEYVTRTEEVRRCFLAPLAIFVFTGILARVLAPDIGGGVSDYSSFFSTTAQVIVAVFIALALELRQMPFEALSTRRLVTGFTLVYIALGAAAACVALLPDLPATLYRWLFATAVAAGSAAVLSVLVIGYQVVKNETADRRREASGSEAP